MVELNHEIVELLPTRNDFNHLPTLTEQIDANVDDAVLGRRVREAMGHSC